MPSEDVAPPKEPPRGEACLASPFVGQAKSLSALQDKADNSAFYLVQPGPDPRPLATGLQRRALPGFHIGDSYRLCFAP